MMKSKTLLQNIIRSGLRTRDQLVVSLRALPREQWNKLDTVVGHLIERGDLTRFQAEKLLRGSTRGLVLGNFELLEPIGKGGISIVYKARDRRTNEIVALKTFVPKSTAQDARALARFQREMELSRLLDHSSIAYTYEVGVSGGIHYLAIEYVHGKSLFKLVTEGGPLTVGRCARLFTEVAAALEHAHSRGLIHRDLKPSNIMVSADDHAKVLDFGLALVKGELELTEVIGGKGYAVGTVDYLPPEQAADSSQVDERSDLYSLGCTMYFALTGRPPFIGVSKAEKIRRHRRVLPTPLLQLNPSLPADFAAIVSKLLAKKPEDRYPSARIVQKKLQAWVSQV